METLNPKAYLTLAEMCEEVNRLRRRLPLLAKTDAVTERTVRFYVQRELLVLPSLRPGPGKQYPYETVWKVLFVRLLSAKHGMPLEHLRQAMHEVPVETMRRVVTGEEPLEVLTTPNAAAAQRHAAQGYQVVPLTGMPERGADAGDWLVLLDSGEVVLKARADLSPAKFRQLQQVAGLVRSILEHK